ncbi:hypothetical protein RISK_003434 [Rhodopirellula islandica]|uniref:Uncharacterized protein n=1 Tax=Rhodopirellula islandica TaxID=595434 RepID=A0A0J1BCR6_RHOIS|nr:hypothetical protein RISK_003434 [Rhodopirellula islandica]
MLKWKRQKQSGFFFGEVVSLAHPHINVCPKPPAEPRNHVELDASAGTPPALKSHPSFLENPPELCPKAI